MAGYSLGHLWRFAESPKERIRSGLRMNGVVRDELRKGSKGKVYYDVWGNTIGVLDTKNRKLWVSNAGWKTKLSKDRINKLIVQGGVVQRKGEWYYQTPKGRLVPFTERGFKFKV